MVNSKNISEKDRLEDLLVKIKIRLNKYYEEIGRYGEISNTEMEDLIFDIDEICNQAKLNKRKLILNKIEEDDED